MAWSSPPAFVVSEVVTAARMNILSDDLTYLKGAPTFDGAPVMAAGQLNVKAASQNNNQIRFQNSAGTNKTAIGSDINTNTGVNTFEVFDLVAGALRLIVADGGSVGVGVAAPQGKLHVKGVGGGWMYLSATAVNNTLQTIAVAGTVTVGMIVWLCDRNNTAGAFTSGFNGQVFSLTSALTYVNTDTLTLTLTAGGAITIQRTTGSNGTHEVNLAVMYF